MLIHLEDNYLSVVMVVCNGEDYIINSLNELFAHLNGHFKNFEVIVIDNASTDNTISILQHSDFKNMHIVELARRHGVQDSITAGVELSIGDYVVEIPDVRLKGIIGKIYELYCKSQEGFDFVFCTPATTTFASRQFYKFLNNYFRNSLKVEIASSMITLASRRGLNRLLAGQSRAANHNVAYSLSGLPCGRINIDTAYNNRRGLADNCMLMLDTVICYTDYVTRLITKIAVVFLIFSIACVGYSTYAFFFKITMPGWVSLFTFVALSFTGIFLIFLILARQMTHILSDSSKKQTYTYRSITKK